MKKIVGIIAVVALLAGACGDDDESAADKNSSPQATETARHEVRLDCVGQRRALGRRQHGREEPHHLGIGIQRGERRAILGAPAPQHEARRHHGVDW